MLETIYTIPVNEAFDASSADSKPRCPFCRLYEKLENDEVGRMLGASLMDPDIRIKTNESGFCRRHYEKMYTASNRLGLGLILESHLAQIQKECKGGIQDALLGNGAKAGKKLEKLSESCYICSRIEDNFGKMIDNAVYLWDADEAFKAKLDAQPLICLPHFRRFAKSAKEEFSGKVYKQFYTQLHRVTFDYFTELNGDVSWFCKKFDYRYEEEPWNNSKDAIERAIAFLSSEEGE